jgi:hypothetical protein
MEIRNSEKIYWKLIGRLSELILMLHLGSEIGIEEKMMKLLKEVMLFVLEIAEMHQEIHQLFFQRSGKSFSKPSVKLKKPPDKQSSVLIRRNGGMLKWNHI